jgi:hypothetical protein
MEPQSLAIAGTPAEFPNQNLTTILTSWSFVSFVVKHFLAGKIPLTASPNSGLS